MSDSKLSANFTVLFSFAIWFYLTASISAQGGFSRPGEPPIMLGLGVMLPVVLITLLYLRKGGLWAIANAIELRAFVLINIFRLLGLDFLVNYYHGHLPSGFALPAGIGDMIAALAAVPLASLISTKPARAYKWFVLWNIFGLLDLIYAIAAGVLHSSLDFGILAAGEVNTHIMGELPHSLVPTYFVPLYMCLHLLMLARAKELYKPVMHAPKE